MFQAIALSIAAALLTPPSLSAQTTTKTTTASFAESATITLQELQHVVPREARIEMEKAERAKENDQPDRYLAHLKKAVEIDPEHIAARNNLAICLAAIDPVAAIAQWEAAIKVNPHKATLFYNLAVVYLIIDDLESSEHAARTSLDLDGTNKLAMGVLGLALIAQNRLSGETVALLTSAGDVYPMASVIAAAVLMNQGELLQARTQLEAYLSSGDVPFREKASELLHLIDHIDRKVRDDISPTVGAGFGAVDDN